jgi:hypothetical protein
MKKVFCFLCVLLLGLGFSSVAKAISPWGDGNEYFMDYVTGLLWYDPIVFQGMSQSELKTWYDGQTECRFATLAEVLDLYNRDLCMDVHRKYTYWEIMGAQTDQYYDATYTFQTFLWVGYYDYATLGDPAGAKVVGLEGNMLLTEPNTLAFVDAWHDVSTDSSVGAWMICDYGGIGNYAVQDIIDAIHEAISNQTLAPVGPGNSAQNRLRAFINKLEATGYLIEVGKLEEARKQLGAIRAKVDGDQSPPDWFEGESLGGILSQIDDLMTAIP